MTLIQNILQAPHYGVRDYKAHLSSYLKSMKPQIVTHHGKPKKVIIEYDEMIELIDILEELQNSLLIKDIQKAREDYQKSPEKAIPAEPTIKSW